MKVKFLMVLRRKHGTVIVSWACCQRFCICVSSSNYDLLHTEHVGDHHDRNTIRSSIFSTGHKILDC